eukprot:Filipodium_phascolosomae@DN8089_c0_g1_i1.p1
MTSTGQMNDEQKDFSPTKTKSRTSWSAKLKYGASKLIRDVEARVATACGLPLEHVEQLIVVRYLPGQYFNIHHDGAFRPWTVLLYLNDVDDGGETLFPYAGVKAHPFKGGAMMWPNVLENGSADLLTLHQGCPLTGGVKYVVNCFVNEDPVRIMSYPRTHGPY